MKDFTRFIKVNNAGYSELRKRYWSDIQDLYKKKGTKVATTDEILVWLRQKGWTNEELAKAHVPGTIVIRGFEG